MKSPSLFLFCKHLLIEISSIATPFYHFICCEIVKLLLVTERIWIFRVVTFAKQSKVCLALYGWQEQR